MQTVLIIIHLIVVLALIAVVLLQRSEGGLGLGGGGGGGGVSGFMTSRGQGNALTKATAILAAIFFVTSLVLSIIAHRGRAPASILEGAAPNTPAGQTAPGGQGGGVLDALRRRQGDQPGSAAPAPDTGPQVPQSR